MTLKCWRFAAPRVENLTPPRLSKRTKKKRTLGSGFNAKNYEKRKERSSFKTGKTKFFSNAKTDFNSVKKKLREKKNVFKLKTRKTKFFKLRKRSFLKQKERSSFNTKTKFLLVKNESFSRFEKTRFWHKEKNEVLFIKKKAKHRA